MCSSYVLQKASCAAIVKLVTEYETVEESGIKLTNPHTMLNFNITYMYARNFLPNMVSDLNVQFQLIFALWAHNNATDEQST